MDEDGLELAKNGEACRCKDQLAYPAVNECGLMMMKVCVCVCLFRFHHSRDNFNGDPEHLVLNTHATF